MIDFREENNTAAILLDLIGSFFSIIGSVFILCLFIKYRQLQNFAFKMIAYLSLSDLIISIGKIITVFRFEEVEDQDDDDFLCYLQAFLINYGGLASVLWTACISFAMKKSVISGITDIQDMYERNFRWLGFGVPLITAIV